jgi:hypothetical protein
MNSLLLSTLAPLDDSDDSDENAIFFDCHQHRAPARSLEAIFLCLAFWLVQDARHNAQLLRYRARHIPYTMFDGTTTLLQVRYLGITFLALSPHTLCLPPLSGMLI